MSARFLLVSRKEETIWPLVLSQALAPLGRLETVSEMDAAERIVQYQCDVIVVIDATVVEDVLPLISRLRRHCPQSCIVVATASPTWQQARDTFRAGAVDYIHKSMDGEDLLTAMRGILSRFLPAQSN